MESVESQQSSRLILDGPPEFTFENTVHRSPDGKLHRSHILSQTKRLHAHPSMLGPGFREPNPRTWFRPWRASSHFEWMGLRLDRPEFEAPSRRLRRLWFPLLRQLLRLSDLGRCHPWRLLRQCVSNGLAYGSELEGLLKRLMRTQPLGRL